MVLFCLVLGVFWRFSVLLCSGVLWVVCVVIFLVFSGLTVIFQRVLSACSDLSVFPVPAVGGIFFAPFLSRFAGLYF